MEEREIIPEDAYVAFLDILGFKEFVKKSDMPKIVRLLQDIKECSEHNKFGLWYATNKGDSRSKYYLHNKCLGDSNTICMSDSIVIVVPNYNQYALAAMIHICNHIQLELFSISDNPILLRGAISKGDIYAREGIVCGPALIEAYLAEEKISVYPRIIFPEDVFLSGKYVIEECDCNLVKKDVDDYYFVNSYAESEINKEIVSRLKAMVNKYLRGYCDPRIREKYRWVKEKLDEVNAF